MLPYDDLLIIIKNTTLNTISFAREAWKQVTLGEGFTNNIRLEVSDFGRIRSYNKINNGRLMKGSMINGYLIIRAKLFRPRDAAATNYLQDLQAGLTEQSKKIKALQRSIDHGSTNKPDLPVLQQQLESETSLLKKNKKTYTSLYNKDVKKRTFYYAALVHRLVAEHFLPVPAQDQTIVTHLDHDKLNNKISNLKWITEEEKSILQRSSPLVIADKQKRKQSGFYEPARYKLTLTKVMFLKKLLNEGKPIQNLAKQFKVSETQILKIKKEESWGSVEAAK